MLSISEFLEQDHARCDGILDQVERQVEGAGWTAAAALMPAFEAALESHLRMEEDGLFPFIEQAMGSAGGPTAVMGMEHQQLRQVLAGVKEAVGAASPEDFFAAAETLRILMGQHNLKEEGILYPMADRLLATRVAAVMAAMQAAVRPASPGTPA